MLKSRCMYLISQTDEWFQEQAASWSFTDLTTSLIKLMKGVGIKGTGKYSKMIPDEDMEYSRPDGESDEDAMYHATLKIFSYLWPTRAYSLIRQQSVFRPTLQETKFIVGKFMHSLWRHRYQMEQK